LQSRFSTNGRHGPDGCPSQFIREHIRSQGVQAFGRTQQLQLSDEKGLDNGILRFVKGFDIATCQFCADFFIYPGTGYVLYHAVQGIFCLGQGSSVAPELLGKHKDSFLARRQKIFHQPAEKGFIGSRKLVQGIAHLGGGRSLGILGVQ